MTILAKLLRRKPAPDFHAELVGRLDKQNTLLADLLWYSARNYQRMKTMQAALDRYAEIYGALVAKIDEWKARPEGVPVAKIDELAEGLKALLAKFD